MVEHHGRSDGSRLKAFFTTLPGVLTGSAALVTAIAALAGIFFTDGGDDGRRGSARTAEETGPEVEFLSPQPGRVPYQTPVAIRYSGVSRESVLWLIERSNVYYPHPNCVKGQSTVEQPTVDPAPGEESGTWMRTIGIGGEDSRPGESFELLVLVTGKQASQLLSEQIRGWCKPGFPWPGIAKLPEEDSAVKAKIKIFR
jgi:hypothetical protein